ncbi:MAG: hypothetical protein R3F49_07230 [Planctomycetota bacterium]
MIYPIHTESMSFLSNCSMATLVACALSIEAPALQEVPPSGVTGAWFYVASSPQGESQLYGASPARFGAPIPLGQPVTGVPSRWAHRRRTLGALETALALPEPFLFAAPMGEGAGTGALMVVDLRGVRVTSLVPTGNPAAYDLAYDESLRYLFSAEDDGLGHTLLRGWTYAQAGALTALNPPSITLDGAPASYVNRITVDEQSDRLHVLTATGLHIVQLAASAPQQSVATSISTGTYSPVTNAVEYTVGGTKHWSVGTSRFDGNGAAYEAGSLTWTDAGSLGGDSFGPVPTAPQKRWVPAAGTSELAVVANGSEAYLYFLLREPAPGTFFVKPSAIGVVRVNAAGVQASGTLLMNDAVGEPFAIPTAHGTRVAFESSFGAPFTANPPGGGEKVSVIYSPLDALGAGSAFGVLGVPAPLGGRISTKGMDRPLWSADGRRVMAATSHFPGAPNPGVPGLEVLEVPTDVLLDEYSAPHRVVENLPFPNQSIVFPSNFRPRVAGMLPGLNGLDFFGNGFHQGTAALAVTPLGELGQLHIDAQGLTQSSAVPNFPAVFPPVFDDVNGSTQPVPSTFGARRASFSANPAEGLRGVRMIVADGARILVQHTGTGVLAQLGLTPTVPPTEYALPIGWFVTTEFAAY